MKSVNERLNTNIHSRSQIEGNLLIASIIDVLNCARTFYGWFDLKFHQWVGRRRWTFAAIISDARAMKDHNAIQNNIGLINKIIIITMNYHNCF